MASREWVGGLCWTGTANAVAGTPTPHQKVRLDHWYSSVQFITELNGRFHGGIRADIHGQNVYERATWVGARLVPKTVNPYAASSSALARPMPDDAPVTSATRLDFIIVSLSIVFSLL